MLDSNMAGAGLFKMSVLCRLLFVKPAPTPMTINQGYDITDDRDAHKRSLPRALRLNDCGEGFLAVRSYLG